MPSFIFYLIVPAAILVYLFSKRQNQSTFLLDVTALALKIAAAAAMMYLIINQYEFGDLYSYFARARDISDEWAKGWFTLDFPELRNSNLVTHLNALIFSIFPPSLYGLAILGGCSSFIFSSLIIAAAERHFNVSNTMKAMILLAPILSMQSGYVGKETYVLPMIGLIVYWLSEERVDERYGYILLAGLFIGAIRGYQVFLVLVPVVIGWMLENRMKLRNVAGLIAVAVGASLATDLWEELTRGEIYTLTEYLSIAYSGGSLVLEPYVFPLSILQNFRPFFWEAHNRGALIASIEYSIFLLYFLWLIRVRIGAGLSSLTGPQLRMTGFFLASAASYMVVFGFNSNLGDLSRRHVYYYPFLLLMLAIPKRQVQTQGKPVDLKGAGSRAPVQTAQHSA